MVITSEAEFIEYLKNLGKIEMKTDSERAILSSFMFFINL